MNFPLLILLTSRLLASYILLIWHVFMSSSCTQHIFREALLETCYITRHKAWMLRKQAGDGDVAQLIGCLPSMNKALGPIQTCINYVWHLQSSARPAEARGLGVQGYSMLLETLSQNKQTAKKKRHVKIITHLFSIKCCNGIKYKSSAGR